MLDIRRQPPALDRPADHFMGKLFNRITDQVIRFKPVFSHEFRNRLRAQVIFDTIIHISLVFPSRSHSCVWGCRCSCSLPRQRLGCRQAGNLPSTGLTLTASAPADATQYWLTPTLSSSLHARNIPFPFWSIFRSSVF